MGQKKLKVVVDTNILVSALGWGGKPALAMDLVLSDLCEWYISKSILNELIRVLNYPKLDFITKEEKETFLSLVIEEAKIIEPAHKLNIIFQDHSDNMFLECALEANAEYLISSDKHLLDLGKHGETDIIRASKFLSLKSEGP